MALIPCKMKKRADVLLGDRGNEILINQYKATELESGFKITGRAQLILAKDEKTDEIVVIKKFNKRRDQNDEYKLNDMDQNELDLASQLLHPNLVRTIEIINDRLWSNIFMVMEFMAGRQIMTYDFGKKCYDSKHGKKLPSDVIKTVMKDVLNGLKYMHEEHIVHRDIKPANILMTDTGIAKLSDFGISERVTLDELNRGMIRGSSKDSGTIGTLWFLPLESFTEEKFDGFSGDIWALGITLYIFLTGKPPLSETSEHKFIQAMKKYNYAKGNNKSIKEKVPFLSGLLNRSGSTGGIQAIDVLAVMLDKDRPSNRPSAAELLSDPYFDE